MEQLLRPVVDRLLLLLSDRILQGSDGDIVLACRLRIGDGQTRRGEIGIEDVV